MASPERLPFSFVRPPEGSSGVVLPGHIYDAVAHPSGAPRLFELVNPSGIPVSQEQFSRTVGIFWNDLSPPAQLLLVRRSLNPRRPVSYEDLMAPLQVRSTGLIAAMEDRALRSLGEKLERLGFQMNAVPGKGRVGVKYFYFIPDATGPESDILDDQGRFLSRQTLEQVIFSLFHCGTITVDLAAFALNTYVSAFPLVPDELSQVMQHERGWSREEIDGGLHRFATLLETAGYRPAIPQEAPEPTPLEITRRQASETTDDQILADLCLNPDPVVIHAVLANPHCGTRHACLIAEHHHSAAGLDTLARHATFARNPGVRQRLLRNSTTPEVALRAIFQGMDLKTLFNVTTGREQSGRAKPLSRNVFPEKFKSSAAQEQAAFITTTEGRCLELLRGIVFDSELTTLLCQRDYRSVILIRNLAIFSGTPKELLRHLLKQPAIRAVTDLKAILSGRIKSG